jgi:hypothetical protein
MRTPHGGFDGYHTSADLLDRLSPAVPGIPCDSVAVGHPLFVSH